MSHILRNPTDEQLLTRLRKIEGQVRGLQRMIERDERCTDTLTQIASVRAALRAVAVGLVDNELRRIVVDEEPTRREAAAAVVLVAVELLVDR